MAHKISPSHTLEHRKIYDKAYRLNHPERFKASQKKYRSSPHGIRKQRDYSLRKSHGITIEDYNRMIVEQQHRCAICGVHQSGIGKAFDVDHNHTTGKIRGLLCNFCNQAIGLFDDSTDILIKAIEYLQKE